MITLITDIKNIKGKHVRLDMNTFFEDILEECKDNIDFLSEKDLEYLKIIDGIQFIDGDYIKTPFGGASIKDLSTGSKTLVILSYLVSKKKDAIVSLNSSGANVLSLVFTDDRYKDFTFFLAHRCFPDKDTNEFIAKEYPNKVFHNLSDFKQYCLDIEISKLGGGR